MTEHSGNLPTPEPSGDPSPATPAGAPDVYPEATARDILQDSPPPRLPPKHGSWRNLLLIFCCWHAGYLVFSILPRVPGQDLAGLLPMDVYRVLTGSRQVWRLFHTIPLMRALRVRLEAIKTDGTVVVSGCLLPGFNPYPPVENSRIFTLFERVLTHPFGVPYREAYVVKVNQLQNAGLPPEAQLKWHLVFEGESIRHLFYSSIDRYLSMPFQKTFGPEKPEEKQP